MRLDDKKLMQANIPLLKPYPNSSAEGVPAGWDSFSAMFMMMFEAERVELTIAERNELAKRAVEKGCKVISKDFCRFELPDGRRIERRYYEKKARLP